MAGGIIIPITSDKGIQTAGGTGGPHYRGVSEFMSPGADQWGKALQRFGQGVEGLGGQLLDMEIKRRQTIQMTALQQDITDFQAASQRFQDDYRQTYKGRDAVNAAEDYTAWNGQAAAKLKEKWKGIDQAQFILARDAGHEALRGSNAMRDYANQELDTWKGGVTRNSQYWSLKGIEYDPTHWQDYAARGLAAIREANPGLDTTAQQDQFLEQCALSAIQSAMAVGQTDDAKKILDAVRNAKGLDPAKVAQFQKVFDQAASQARVGGWTQTILAAGREGRGWEAMQEAGAALRRGDIDLDEYEAITKTATSIQKNELEAQKADRDQAVERQEQELLNLEGQGKLTAQMILGSDLPADKKKFWVGRVETSQKGLNNREGRAIDGQIKEAIDHFGVTDTAGLYALASQLDPAGKYISMGDMDGYEKRMVEMGGKANYFNDAMKVAQESDLLKSAGKVDGEKVARFKAQVLAEMKLAGVAETDPRAGQMVSDALKTTIKDHSGFFGLGSTPWWEAPADSRPSLLGEGAARAQQWPTADVVDTAIKNQGLLPAPGNRARMKEALETGQGFDETRPSFAREWAGKGYVTLRTLGQVHLYDDLVEKYALAYGEDPNLVAAMMYVESRGNPYAESPAGAKGLMQFMPGTAREYGVTDPFDPEQSIRGACAYLRRLLDDNGGNTAKALGAYNAGQGRVDSGKLPGETRDYVPTITEIYLSAPRAEL